MSENDFPTEIAKSKVELDVERHLLGTTVRLSDGSEGIVFSRGSKNESHMFLYNCHLCGVPNLPGERCLQTHISGKKHQVKLSQPIIDAEIFRAPLIHKPKIQMNIAPGEPVPPGFENEVKPMAEIQKFLDKYKESALIGLEYTIELANGDDKEPGYICLLCDKRGDPRTIVAHWTSYNHRLKYLEKHFPSIIKELGPYRFNPEARNVMPRVIQTIIEAIEDHHSRLVPSVYDNSDFQKNRHKILQEIIADKHFDEKRGPSFVNFIDKSIILDAVKSSKSGISINIDKKRDPSPPNVKAPKRFRHENLSSLRKTRDSLDSISSDSSSSIGRRRKSRERSNRRSRSRSFSRSRSRSRSYDRNGKKKRKSQSPAYRILPRVKRSPPFEEKRRSKSPPYRVHPRVQRSPPFETKRLIVKTDKKISLPSPRELSIQASEIAQERYKWEKYRCMVELAIKELENALKEHGKNPEKHPLYPDEWKKFWNRRYKELQAEKKDPNKYDFKPEWIIFWTKRMKEIHDEECEKKKCEIRKKLGLPEDGEEKTDQLKQQYTIKAPNKNVDGKIDKTQIIDISDDDDSLSSHSTNFTKRRSTKSPKRSTSPISDDYDRRDKKSLHSITTRERYPPPPSSAIPDYYHPSSKWMRSAYYGGHPPHPSTHYGSYRTMDSYSYPKYEPEPKEEEVVDEPLTVVAVLRLLTALEDLLGSLGPKIIDLLAKALALEKIKANSADDMLLNEDTSVFFETVKEKLKGQLIAGVLDSNKVKAVKKAIKNIAGIIHQVNEKATQKPKEQEEKKIEEVEKKVKLDAFDRQTILSKLAAALVINEKTNITTDDMDRLINVFILMVKISKEKKTMCKVKDILIDLGVENAPIVEAKQLPMIIDPKVLPLDMFANTKDEDETPVTQNATTSLESLTDSDLQTLLQNFKHLSSEEQHHLIAHLKKLESTNPGRVEKLRKFVDITDLNKEKKIASPTKQTSIKEISPTNNDEDEDAKVQKMLDSDDDDDDYNFDDVVKAASNNINKDNITTNKTIDEQYKRNDSITNERDGDISNISRASSTSTANLNISLADTQNLIANLMGSLQKTSANYTQNNKALAETSNTIPTILGRTNNNTITNNNNNKNSNNSQPSSSSNAAMFQYFQQHMNTNNNNNNNGNEMYQNENPSNNVNSYYQSNYNQIDFQQQNLGYSQSQVDQMNNFPFYQYNNQQQSQMQMQQQTQQEQLQHHHHQQQQQQQNFMSQQQQQRQNIPGNQANNKYY